MGHGLNGIELSDLSNFEGKLPAQDDPPSQLNFYQLWLTREEMMIKTYVEDDFSFVVGWSSECDYALYGPPLPLVTGAKALLSQLKKCEAILRSENLGKPEEGLYIVLLNERWSSSFENIGAQIFSTRDDDNYLYRTAEVGNLTGAALNKRRTKIRSFVREHGTLQSKELNELQVSDAREVILKWHQNKVAKQDDVSFSEDHRRLLHDDFNATLLTLQNLKALPLEGEVYYLNNEPVGFISGIPFYDHTFLGLSFKSLRIRGLADVIFSSFSRKLSTRYDYLNTGQDLDIPSLRTFKEEWAPCRMLKTFRAYVPARVLNAVS